MSSMLLEKLNSLFAAIYITNERDKEGQCEMVASQRNDRFEGYGPPVHHQEPPQRFKISIDPVRWHAKMLAWCCEEFAK